MRNFEPYKLLQNDYYFQQENNVNNDMEDVSIVIHRKKLKKRNIRNEYKHTQQPVVAFQVSSNGKSKERSSIIKHSSISEINIRTTPTCARSSSGHTMITHNKNPFQSNFIVNVVSGHHFDRCMDPFNYPGQPTAYQCEVSEEEQCCCCCNSDALFEVMRGLYECYKKKNCCDCRCILCCHLKREERKLGELRKSLADAGIDITDLKDKKIKIKPVASEKIDRHEKILRGLAMAGMPLPEGKTSSDKNLITKVRTELGVPIEPKTKAIRDKHEQAAKEGKLLPLEGKTTAQKEVILKAQHDMGIPLPIGRTPSEQALIDKISARPRPLSSVLSQSERIRRAKVAGLLSPIDGKTPAQKEKVFRGLAKLGLPLPEGKSLSERKIIKKVRAEFGLPPPPRGLPSPVPSETLDRRVKIFKGLALAGMPLPEGQTPSDKKLMKKIRTELGVPIEPKTKAMRVKHEQAAREGKLLPLEGKTHAQKEVILKAQHELGIPLPIGRTPSEKALIERISADTGPLSEVLSQSERMRRAKAVGLLSPIKGKTPAEKEKILRGLANFGLPLPAGQTPSEVKLIKKVGAELRLPPPPKAPPMEGSKSPVVQEKLDRREKILKGLAMAGMALPEGHTPSDKNLIKKIRTELGVPTEPKTKSTRTKHEYAAREGILLPLEGKTPAQKEMILQAQHDMGIPLPIGRSPSEQALINKISAGPRNPPEVLSPLVGEKLDRREKVLKGLVMAGIPLPEGQTHSDRSLINKVRYDLGLPIEPKTKAIRDKHEQAAREGKLVPLEKKTPAQQESILQGLHDMGIPLPVGRTPSEQARIDKIMAGPQQPSGVLSQEERMRRAKAAGLLSPLEGKTPAQKEKNIRDLASFGLPLPEGQSPSEIKIINKVRAEFGLAPQTEIIKPQGLLSPLVGEKLERRENILRSLVMAGIPLPEGQTKSDKNLINKVRYELGAPIEPKTKAIRDKHELAAREGKLVPLEKKTPAQQEVILKALHDRGIPLPIGRTPSERARIDKVMSGPRPHADVSPPSEKIRGPKVIELPSPLQGKTHAQKEKILQDIAISGRPLPEGKTKSEIDLINKVRVNYGLPPPPKTKHKKPQTLVSPSTSEDLDRKSSPLVDVSSPTKKMRKPKVKVLPSPLEGKTPAQKEKFLQDIAISGLPLPEGKTKSDIDLINKVRVDYGLPPQPKTKHKKPQTLVSPSISENLYRKPGTPPFSGVSTPIEKIRRPKVQELPSPLEGKTPAQKEKILQDIVISGLPLPEGKTKSDIDLINKIRVDYGLPPQPKTKHKKPQTLVSPKVSQKIPGVLSPEERLRKARAAGLVSSPLQGKTPVEKETIFKDLAKSGLPLPEGSTPSEIRMINKFRDDLGLPPEPKTPFMKQKHAKAAELGLLYPLEGKPHKEKEKILQGLNDLGIPLPEGRSASEKSLVKKIKAKERKKTLLGPPALPPEERRKLDEKTSKAIKESKGPIDECICGLLTPESEREVKNISKPITKPGRAATIVPSLKGKTPEQQQDILIKLAQQGYPLPEGKTASEKKIINKVRIQLDLPPDNLGKPLSESRSASEKDIVRKIKPKERKQTLLGPPALPPKERRKLNEKTSKAIKESKGPVDECICGLLTPESEREVKFKTKPITKPGRAATIVPSLKGKTPEQQQDILIKLAQQGIPLPEGKTASEKKIINKVRVELDLPPDNLRKPLQKSRSLTKPGRAASFVPSLKGKTPEQQQQILINLAQQGIPLPEGKTASEKTIINKVRIQLDLPPDNLGRPLPKGRSASEQAIVRKIKPKERKQTILGPPALPPKERRKLDEKTSKAIKESKGPVDECICGLFTPESEREVKFITKPITKSGKAPTIVPSLKGKTPEQQQDILIKLAQQGIPLPEGKTPSEKKIISKVQLKLDLPPDKLGRPLPESLSALDKAIVRKIKPEERKQTLLGPPALPPKERRKLDEKTSKAIKESKGPVDECICGLFTPESEREVKFINKPVSKPGRTATIVPSLKGKTPEQQQDILIKLAQQGIPLPEGKTASEKKIISKVRLKLDLPPDKLGRPLPESLSALDKAIVRKIKPEERKQTLLGPPALPPKERRKLDEKTSKAIKESKGPVDECICGLFTPESEKEVKFITKPVTKSGRTATIVPSLKGKTPEQQQDILIKLAQRGMPLPEGKTASEKKVISKVRLKLDLPPDNLRKPLQKSRSLTKPGRAASFVPSLKGKTPEQQQQILINLAQQGIPLPEGKTASEKTIINKVRIQLDLPPDNLGRPLPKGRSASEQAIVRKIKPKERKQTILGPPALPPKERRKLDEKTSKAIKESKGPVDECICGLFTPESEREVKFITKPVTKPGRTATIIPSLKGKTPEQQQDILIKLAQQGIPLPEGKTPSEKKVINKVRIKLELPPENLGRPLPKGRSASEKTLVQKIRLKERSQTLLGTPALPPKERRKLDEKTSKAIKEGKGPVDECICGLFTPESEREVKFITKPITKPGKAASFEPSLKGKTPEQQQEILIKLAQRGMPLPEGKTASEKNIINKVRVQLDLPPDNSRRPLQETRSLTKPGKAASFEPSLKAKTPEEQQDILMKLAQRGMPLPEGKTASEKKVISKVRLKLDLPPDKLGRPLTEGRSIYKPGRPASFAPTLKGKTPEQQQDILIKLAQQGIPLPEGKTASEKKIINKVRLELELPPDKLGRPLPEGRSASEKPLVRKIRSKERKQTIIGPPALPPKERRKLHERTSKAIKESKGPVDECICGLLTPESEREVKYIPKPERAAGFVSSLEGKSPEQKKEILIRLVQQGIPLPEGRTASEKKFISKVRVDLGLPPDLRTPSLKEKYAKAQAAGLVTPLEGKSLAQKKKILKGLHGLGVPFPDGLSPSEQVIADKIKAKSTASISSDKIQKAKSAGLLTPLKGKSPEQKENILRGLAKIGLPLPEGITPSEQKIVLKIKKEFDIPHTPRAEKKPSAKVRTELGLPPDLRTPSLKDKYAKAQVAGLVTPLEGKSPAQKEKILRGLHALGVPLPEGLSPSEQVIVDKIKAKPTASIPSDKIQKAKAAGLLTPLEGKSPEQKENILRGLANIGLPLPEGITPSEQKIVLKIKKEFDIPHTPRAEKKPSAKVRTELGLPPDLRTPSLKDKYAKAQAAGLTTPLEGKSSAQKEKILKGLYALGVPLPEGLTPSEQVIVNKIKAKATPSITSDKIQKAKAAGLLTPLQGKSPEQKEKILRGLAKIGLPLPEGITPSEQTIVLKIKKELGLPDITPSEKIRNAEAAGFLTPIEGKKRAQKEKILRGRAAAGLPLPIGTTASDKALIKKIKEETDYVAPSLSDKLIPKSVPHKSHSEKMKEAKAAGLLAPLKGKTREQKENILRGLAKVGLPLPEPKTASDKDLITKIRKEVGLPPEPDTPSLKEKYKKAQAAGLITPLEGKTPAEKENILRKLQIAGIPFPEGRTPSEQSMIKKIKGGLPTPLEGKSPSEKEKIVRDLADGGLSPEATRAGKIGKIKTKAEKFGAKASKLHAKGLEAEKLEEIMKTTTCDRGCGCDQKKIRFKHSYVKIKVTSPDISSLCSCPYECIPGVKAGTFIDKEGIKVIVGSVIGTPSYSRQCSESNTDYKNRYTNDIEKDSKVSPHKIANFKKGTRQSRYFLDPSSSDVSHSTRPYSTESDNVYLQSSTPYEGRTSKSDRILKSARVLQLYDDIYRDPVSKPSSNLSSIGSIFLIRSETSISLCTNSNGSMDSISIILDANNSVTSNFTHYSDFPSSYDLLSSHDGSIISMKEDLVPRQPLIRASQKSWNIRAAVPKYEYTIFRMSKENLHNDNQHEEQSTNNPDADEMLNKLLPSTLSLTKIMEKVLTKKRFTGASSIFIVIPTDNDSDDDYTNALDSGASFQSSKIYTNPTGSNPTQGRKPSITITICGKGKKFYMREICSQEESIYNKESIRIIKSSAKTMHKSDPFSTPNEPKLLLEKNNDVIDSDTTADGACYRRHLGTSTTVVSQKLAPQNRNEAKATSKQITPLFLRSGIKSWFRGTGAKAPITTPEPMCPIPSWFNQHPYNALSGHHHHHQHLQTDKGSNCAEPQHKTQFDQHPCNAPPGHYHHQHLQHAKGSDRAEPEHRTQLEPPPCKCNERPVNDMNKPSQLLLVQRCSGIEGNIRNSPRFQKSCVCPGEDVNKASKSCACTENQVISGLEKGLVPGTKSRGALTELKAEDIQTLERYDAGLIEEHDENVRFEELDQSNMCCSQRRGSQQLITDLDDEQTPQKVCRWPSPRLVNPFKKIKGTKITATSSSNEDELEYSNLEQQIPTKTTTSVITDINECLPKEKLSPKNQPGIKTNKQTVGSVSSSSKLPTPKSSKKKPKSSSSKLCTPKVDCACNTNEKCVTDNVKKTLTKEDCKCKNVRIFTQTREGQKLLTESDSKIECGCNTEMSLSPDGQKNHKTKATGTFKTNSKILKFITAISRSSSKISKVDCACTANIEKPQPESVVIKLPPEIIEYPSEYARYGCGWIDVGKVMRARSEMALEFSGFKIFKRKNTHSITSSTLDQQCTETSGEVVLGFEDAIKYYTSTNPELFKDLLPEETYKILINSGKGEKKRKKAEKKALAKEKAKAKKKLKEKSKKPKKRKIKGQLPFALPFPKKIVSKNSEKCSASSDGKGKRECKRSCSCSDKEKGKNGSNTDTNKGNKMWKRISKLSTHCKNKMIRRKKDRTNTGTTAQGYEDDCPSLGFKLVVGGDITGSRGGYACFDMMHESYMSW